MVAKFMHCYTGLCGDGHTSCTCDCEGCREAGQPDPPPAESATGMTDTPMQDMLGMAILLRSHLSDAAWEAIKTLTPYGIYERDHKAVVDAKDAEIARLKAELATYKPLVSSMGKETNRLKDALAQADAENIVQMQRTLRAEGELAEARSLWRG